ncbi:MAG: TIR domain-containing protein [Candidatus Omnitrophota bacterium]
MKRVFLSFDRDDFLRVKGLLAELSKLNCELDFYEGALDLDSASADAVAVKQAIGEKIVHSDLTVCLIGNNTHLSRWVDIELRKSREKGNKIIAMALKGITSAVLPQVIKEENITFYPWDPKRLGRIIEEKSPSSPISYYKIKDNKGI